jgi:hypothetical protein
MKNIIKSLLAVTLITGFASCEDEQDLLFTAPSGTEFTILTPESGSSIVLNKDFPDNPALTMSWNPAIYDGAPTEITYHVEMIKDGEDFNNPTNVYEIGTTTNRSIAFTTNELNTAAGNLGLSADAPGVLNIRIRATVGTIGEQSSYSNVIVYTVTPYLSYLFKDLYLVGEAVAPGWETNNNNPPLWRDPAVATSYQYVGYFNAGGFKLIEKLGSWQPQWGTNDGVTVSGNPGTQSDDPGTFNNTLGAGYYTFTVNMNPNSYSYTLEPYTGSTATTYGSIGLIGDATPGGWDAETPMTQSTFDPHIWYIESITLTNGSAKFRANNDWPINWGADTQYSGTGVGDGPNIPVTATNYKVWFNDLTGQYMMIPLAN